MSDVSVTSPSISIWASIKEFIGLNVWTAEQRRTYRELSALTDRELNDIGLARCDLRDLVNDL